MTTIAFYQYCNIPFLGGSYNCSSVQMSRNTHNTPLQMLQHNLGALNGVHPNPPHFQYDSAGGDFASKRSQYVRTNTTQNNFGVGRAIHAPRSQPSTHYVAGLQRSFPMCQTTSYVAPACSSMYLAAKKSAAIGKTSFKEGLPPATFYSTKAPNVNDAKTRLQRVRNRGSVAPAKCGSIYNPYRGHNSHWGAGGVKSTY